MASMSDEDAPAQADDARLSRLLFEAREAVEMYADVVAALREQSGKADRGRRVEYLDRLRDEIDAYRAERGWSPHGYGGE